MTIAPDITTRHCPMCKLADALTVTRAGDGPPAYDCSMGCAPEDITVAMAAHDQTVAELCADRYRVRWTQGATPKLILPKPPLHDDLAGAHCWLTHVLALNPAMPVTGVVHEGPRGGDGHLHLSRSGARPLRFEPADLILNPRRLKAKMQFQRDVTDPPQYGYTEAHCSAIADVCNKAAGASAEPDINADTDAIVGTFTARAQRIEGLTTYGTTVDRYRAMDALRPPPGERDYDRAHGPLRYLKDANTGDLVIRVSDLLSVARDHRGGSIEHGWLDARMQHLGWERARLRGYAEAGRAGRTGPMLRCDVYRGIEPCDMDAPDA